MRCGMTLIDRESVRNIKTNRFSVHKTSKLHVLYV